MCPTPTGCFDQDLFAVYSHYGLLDRSSPWCSRAYSSFDLTTRLNKWSPQSVVLWVSQEEWEPWFAVVEENALTLVKWGARLFKSDTTRHSTVPDELGNYLIKNTTWTERWTCLVLFLNSQTPMHVSFGITDKTTWMNFCSSRNTRVIIVLFVTQCDMNAVTYYTGFIPWLTAEDINSTFLRPWMIWSGLKIGYLSPNS